MEAGEKAPHVVEVLEVQAQPLATIRTRTKRNQLSSVVPSLCGKAWEGVRKHPEIQKQGALMVAIYCPEPADEPPNPDEIDIAVGVQVARPFEPDGDLVFLETPAGTVAHTAHIGSYAGLGDAHNAIQQWREESGETFAGPSWEVYGQWKEDESKLRTDIYYLLR